MAILLIGNVAYADDHSCHYCGMYRSQFGHSWVILEHDNSPAIGVCSVHCAVIHMALHTDKFTNRITVGDYNSHKQIDADRAFWVIGGNKVGVMTTRAKWAFATKDKADEFMSKHGGRPSTFSEVLEASFEDMYQDVLMIQKKRRMMKIRKAK